MQMDQIVTQQVIDTDRFVLRPLRKSDKGMIEMYAGQDRLARMTTSIPHPLPPGVTEAFIQRSHEPDRTEDVWALDGTAMGAAEVMGITGGLSPRIGKPGVRQSLSRPGGRARDRRKSPCGGLRR